MGQKINWQTWAAIAVCAGAGYLLLRYAAGILIVCALPFLIAGLIEQAVAPLAARFSQRTRLNRRVCTVLFFFAFLLIAVLVFVLLAAQLFREAQELIARMLADVGSPSSAISDVIDAIRLPDFEGAAEFRARAKDLLTDAASGFLDGLGTRLPTLAGKLVAGFPTVLLFVVATVFSGFWLCMDGNGVRRGILSCLPRERQEQVEAFFRRRRSGLRRFSERYLRAYLLLFLLTFSLLAAGFLILGLHQAILPAFLIALVDLFPVLGVGTVLFPWAILELLRQDYRLGSGLLILMLVVAVIRQIAEPRIVGKSLGLHPLLSLAAGYIGWNLVGVSGLVVGPFVALAVRSLLAGRNSGQFR